MADKKKEWETNVIITYKHSVWIQTTSKMYQKYLRVNQLRV